MKKPIEYYDPKQYTSSYTADSRGYHSVHKQTGLEQRGPFGNWIEHKVAERDIGFAFSDEHGKLIRVDPVDARGDTSAPLKLAHWSDGEGKRTFSNDVTWPVAEHYRA